MSFLKRSVLALKTLLWVLLGSLLVFVVATSIGVWHERERSLASAHDEARKAVVQNLGTVAVALWHYDTASLQALLGGMTRTGTIIRIEVLDGNTVVAERQRSSGDDGSTGEDSVDLTWSQPVIAPDGSRQIGSIRVFESYREVHQRINSALATLVATELSKIIGLTFILFVIVYRLIARHLTSLSADVANLNPADLGARVALQRKSSNYRDELDTLTTAINRFLQERGEEMHKRSQAELSLREHMAEIEVILGALSDGVVAFDRDCRVRFANAAARTLLGVLRDPLQGKRFEEILHVIDERTGRPVAGVCHSTIRDGVPIHLRGNVRIRTADGVEFDARISAVPAPESGEVAMILVFTDISAEISKERQIEFQAFHDPLTELGNRSMLARDLPPQVDKALREGYRLAILCLDLDNFKNINDALGHTIGDVLLQQLAQRFREMVHSPGLVTRHGGDEFIIVVPAPGSIEQVTGLADALMQAIAQPFHIDGHDLRITSSIGISLCPDHGINIGELVSNADMAMYEAKRGGRNAYRFYELDQLQRSAKRLSMENGLRVALAEQRFSLVFQPKVAVVGERVDALEALLRWHTASGEAVSPAVFIPVAEEVGLIIEIGEWVLRQSLAASRRIHQTLGRYVPIAVNVSPLQFRSERLMSVLRELAAAEPELNQLLEIELTENALAGNMEEVTATLNNIKALGLKIAIDDFGTGYSSLAYLKNFPIDILKIDQAFIRGLHLNSQDRAIVGSVVQLGKSLGFRIVAEGVEEMAQRDILADLQCDYIQGYLYAKPMPEALLLRYLGAAVATPA